MMRSAAVAPEPPTYQPNREAFWLSAEQGAWRHTQSGTHARTPTQLRSITRPNVLCVHARGPGSSLMPYRCPRRPFWAAVVVGIARSRWYRTDVPPAAAFQAHASSCRLRACIPCVTHNEHAACGLSSPQISAGRGRFCARVASELLDARLPSECARAERYFGAHGRLTPVRDRCQRETA